jgi:aspartyl-tRNA(Asn)/glutamyl-tRNA(Gln) amidotransferase subunit B
MRRKEEAHDYRYFPDPDLLPLVVEESWVESLRGTIPELPDAKVARFAAAYALSRYDAELLASSRQLADAFEAAVALFPGAPKTTANECIHWKEAVSDGRLAPAVVAALVEDREKGTISATASKTLAEAYLSTGKDVRILREELGLTQESDSGALEAAVRKVVGENPKEAESYRGGKTGLLSFFVGQVMKETKGKANPKLVSEVVRKELG